MPRIHPEASCKPGYCPFHNPSDHHMNTWPKTVRYDRWCMTERLCEHGVGHPDPDSMAWAKTVQFGDNTLYEMMGGEVHGCCGCCQDSG